MKVIANKEYAIASCDVRAINCKELRQMFELKTRIDNVLESHKTDKKQYVSDDDLRLMSVILKVFTKEYAETQNSAFDEELEKIQKTNETENESEKVEVLIKGGPGSWPEAPIAGESKNF